jgi:hypothetical protein
MTAPTLTFDYPFLSFDAAEGDGFADAAPEHVLLPNVPALATVGSVGARDQPGPIRKQNHSCDQCRKGKRRCDAVVLRDWVVEDAELPLQANLPSQYPWEVHTPEPCGNCTRTKKTCTFEWLKSQEPGLRARKESSNSDSVQLPKARVAKRAKANGLDTNTAWQTSLSPADTFWSGVCYSDSPSSATLRSASASSRGLPPGIGSLRQIQDNFGSDLPAVDFPQDHYLFPEADCTLGEYSNPDINQYGGPAATSSLVRRQGAGSAAGFSLHSSSVGSIWSEDGLDNGVSDISYLFPRPKRSASPQIETGTSDESGSEQTGDAPRIDFLFDPSPVSLPERLAKSANHTYLRESLMKIYHDSMENALSCWLNERTCPYRLKAVANEAHTGDEALRLQQEWGPDWSNRVFRRVFSLDQRAGKIRDRPLSKTEETAASKALYLVIMAFATQWAQSSKRSREKHPAGMAGAASKPDADRKLGPDQTEFDRTIQEAYWREARRALLDCADIE